MPADSICNSAYAPDAEWRVDTLSGLRLPPGLVERPDGVETIGVRMRAYRASSLRVCLDLAARILGDMHLTSGGQLAALAGALPGIRLTVAPDGSERLLMEVRGGVCFARRILYRGQESIKALLNARLDADPSRQGFGTASQTVELAAAIHLGTDRIEAFAASLDGDVGWLVLPRWGFDAELQQHFVDDLPDRWSGLRRLAQVLEQAGGWEWWEKQRAILDVEFDLHKDAVRYSGFRNYLNERLAAGRPMPTLVGMAPTGRADASRVGQ
jgi:hypothetical protein